MGTDWTGIQNESQKDRDWIFFDLTRNDRHPSTYCTTMMLCSGAVSSEELARFCLDT